MFNSNITTLCLLLAFSHVAFAKSHFIVAADEWSPFFEVTSGSADKPYNGVMLQLLEYVRQSLNFTYEIRRPPDGQWGVVLKNGTVTGMVGMVSRNEVDFALGEYPSFLSRDANITFKHNISHSYNNIGKI